MVAGYNLMPEDFIGMLPKMTSNFLEDKTQAAKFAGIWLFNTVAIGGAAYYLGNPLLKAAFAPIPMAVELIYKSMIGGNPLAELTGNAAANTAFAGFAVGYGLKLFGKTLVDATYAQKEKLMDWIMPIPMYQAAAEHLIIASLCSVHMVFNYNTIKSLAIPVAGALLGAGAGWAASHSYPQYSEENLAFSAEDTIVS